MNELVARASRLLQRTNPQLLAEVINVGDIELDRAAMVVRRRGQMVHLGPTDYRLLEFMMQAPGRVFSREQLLNNVWGDDVYIDDRTVDVHIGDYEGAAAGVEDRSDPHRTGRRLQSEHGHLRQPAMTGRDCQCRRSIHGTSRGRPSARRSATVSACPQRVRA